MNQKIKCKCIVCNREFVKWMLPRKHFSSECIRPSHALTCSSKCSKFKYRFPYKLNIPKGLSPAMGRVGIYHNWDRYETFGMG